MPLGNAVPLGNNDENKRLILLRAPLKAVQIDIAFFIEHDPLLLKQMSLQISAVLETADARSACGIDDAPPGHVGVARQAVQRPSDGPRRPRMAEHGRNLAIGHYPARRYAPHQPPHRLEKADGVFRSAIHAVNLQTEMLERNHRF